MIVTFAFVCDAHKQSSDSSKLPGSGVSFQLPAMGDCVFSLCVMHGDCAGVWLLTLA